MGQEPDNQQTDSNSNNGMVMGAGFGIIIGYVTPLAVSPTEGVLSIGVTLLPSTAASTSWRLAGGGIYNGEHSDLRFFNASTGQRAIWLIENGQVTTWLENLKGPNGVLIDGNDLFVLDAGTLYKVEKDKTLTKLADGMEGGTDGVEHVTGKDYIVSCWAGSIWYVNGDGTKQNLLDTREQKINTADIGYDPKNRILFVPTFFKNKIVAYELK
jgi:sugar lactone lactonase YvrE